MARKMTKTRDQLITEQEELHGKRAKLPYLKKIELVDKMRDMVKLWGRKSKQGDSL